MNKINLISQHEFCAIEHFPKYLTFQQFYIKSKCWVSWSNESQPTGVGKPVYGIPTFPLTAKAV